MVVEADLLGYMVDTYLTSIDISYDVLWDAYLLDILVHAFGMSMGYIVGHVVDEVVIWCIIDESYLDL